MESDELPQQLRDAFDLLALNLLPMAIRAAQVPEDFTVFDLAKPQPAGTGDVRAMLATLAQLLAVASLSWQHDQDEHESADLTGAAVSFAQFVHGYVSRACGEGADEALRAVRRAMAKAAAHARHAPTRDARALVGAWWVENGKGRMTKEAAADAIVARRIVGESRRTVRGWLVGL